MGWLVGAKGLGSKQVQGILGDVFLHAKYWNYIDHTKLAFVDEGRWRLPHFIEEVHLFRPGRDFLWSEALRVTYDNGSFYLESDAYKLKERAALDVDLHPLAVSKILDKSSDIWFKRWQSENGLEGRH